MTQPAVTQYRVVVWFDSREQAQVAAEMVRTMHPRAYDFSGLTAAGVALWRETGEDYGASSVRL